MKKIIIIAFASILFIIMISATFNKEIEDITDYNNKDFDKLNLNCRYGNINIIKDNDKFKLVMPYTCLSYSFYSSTQLENEETTFYLEYADNDFFTCVRLGNPDLECFNTYIRDEWETEILNYQYFQKEYLKRLTTYESMVSKNLSSLYSN